MDRFILGGLNPETFPKYAHDGTQVVRLDYMWNSWSSHQFLKRLLYSEEEAAVGSRKTTSFLK